MFKFSCFIKCQIKSSPGEEFLVHCTSAVYSNNTPVVHSTPSQNVLEMHPEPFPQLKFLMELFPRDWDGNPIFLQLDIRSAWYSYSLIFLQLDIPPAWYSYSLIFLQLDIPSAWYSYSLIFLQLDILTAWYSYSLILLQLDITKVWYSYSLIFLQLDITKAWCSFSLIFLQLDIPTADILTAWYY